MDTTAQPFQPIFPGPMCVQTIPNHLESSDYALLLKSRKIAPCVFNHLQTQFRTSPVFSGVCAFPGGGG
jgi:hypothetical protein